MNMLKKDAAAIAVPVNVIIATRNIEKIERMAKLLMDCWFEIALNKVSIGGLRCR